jgi:DHA2 family multidrug resistance protein-like MFS transporter
LTLAASSVSPDASLEADGLPTPRRYWAILAIGLALTLSVLDSAIANVALPTIAGDLHASPAASIWVVNAYQLATVISLLPLAALGEIIGYRRVYQAGLALFVVASLGCALARSIDTLALARTVQGFGAAGIMSVNGALVRFTYPHNRLGQGIGINAMVVSIAAAIGPTVASAILAVAPWPWLFGVNVPIGLAAIAVAAFALPRTPTSDRLFDWKSAVLNAFTFGLLIFGVEMWGRGHGWLGPLVVMGGLAAGVVLCMRELPRPAPLVPFDLLRVPIFGLSVATSICSFTAQMLAFVSLPFFFERVMGYSAVETGLLMTPWPVAVSVAAPIAGHLADRWPAGLLGGVGLALLAAGLGLLALLPAHAEVADIVWRMAICGLGFGMFQSPNNRVMMSSAPLRRAGAAGGMLATARLIGQTAGAAGVALIFRLQGHGATNLTLVVAAVVAAVAACVSLTRLVGGDSAAPRPAGGVVVDG